LSSLSARFSSCVPPLLFLSRFSLYSTQSGLSLSIGGYSQKQSILLAAILQQMRSLRVTDRAADFARLRERMRRGLLNFIKENPYSHAVFDEVLAMEDTLWTHQEKLAVIDSLTAAQVDAFSAQLLQHGELEMFVHGNVVEAEVRAVATEMQAALQLRPLFASQLPRARVVQLDPKHTYLRQYAGRNPADANSCSLNLYQLGENTVELHAAAELFAHLVREPLFNQLHTKEQLGYLTWSNLTNMKGVLHWRVLIQSAAAPANYLDYRIEAFLVRGRHLHMRLWAMLCLRDRSPLLICAVLSVCVCVCVCVCPLSLLCCVCACVCSPGGVTWTCPRSSVTRLSSRPTLLRWWPRSWRRTRPCPRSRSVCGARS